MGRRYPVCVARMLVATSLSRVMECQIGSKEPRSERNLGRAAAREEQWRTACLKVSSNLSYLTHIRGLEMANEG